MHFPPRCCLSHRAGANPRDLVVPTLPSGCRCQEPPSLSLSLSHVTVRAASQAAAAARAVGGGLRWAPLSLVYPPLLQWKMELSAVGDRVFAAESIIKRRVRKVSRLENSLLTVDTFGAFFTHSRQR